MRNIDQFLNENGYRVVVETSGLRGKSLIHSINPILVILDILLPDVDGLSICRDVRASYRGPILVMSEFTDAIDEVASLETGADGYLTKSVQPRVLLAHVRALLRRNYPFFTQTQTPQNSINPPLLINRDVISIGQIKISLTQRTVWVNEQRILLTSGEFDVLYHLASHAGQILSRDELYFKIRGIEYDGVDRVIDQHISNIRKKLGDNSRNQMIIKSVRGIGYMLTA